MIQRLIFCIARKVQYEIYNFWLGEYRSPFFNTRSTNMLNSFSNWVDSRNWDLSV